MIQKNQTKKFIVLTWGCQMNEHDSEIVRALLEDKGYQWTGDFTEANLIVLNTCSVRKSAEQKVLGFLGNLKHQKKKKPGTLIAVGGCMTQNPEIVDILRKKTPFVNIIFGTRNFHRLPTFIAEAEQTKSQVVEPSSEDEEIPNLLPAHHTYPVKAYVTIMYGCDNFCSYCVVPYTRGREKSRPLEEISGEITKLVAQGYREVMLLGQNVNAYGKDLPGNINFVTLLRHLDQISRLSRIRYMTSHPRDFNEELIETIATSQKVCEHFHLPLQAGSNTVLDKMNRGYNREQYLELTKKIRNIIPAASITTDLIVGFPGETEKDFQDTLDLVKKIHFDTAYTFMYSPRPGTLAAQMKDHVPKEEKKLRLTRLVQVQNQISLAINKTLEGQIWEVLVEGRSKTNPARWSGRTRTNKIVVFEGDENLIGKIVEIKIECARTWTLLGSLKNVRGKEESFPLPRSKFI